MMSSHGSVLALSLIMSGAALIAGCQPADDEPATESAATQADDADKAEDVQVFEAGDHCYSFESDQSTEGLRLTVNEKGSVMGVHFGVIHDEENAYYAAFETTLTDGQISGTNTVKFNTETHVDGDHQFGEDNWVIMPEMAHLMNWPDKPLTTTECEGLETFVYGEAPEE